MNLTCPDCGESKPNTEFYKDKSKSSGHHPYCKPCARARSADRYRRRTGAEVPSSRACAYCSTNFKPRTGTHIFCSDKCSTRARRIAENPDYQPRPASWGTMKNFRTGTQMNIIACAICNNMFESNQPMKRTCSDECATQYTTRTDTTRSDRRRARLRKVRHETIVRKTVYERDRWICGICGEAINPHAKYPDRMSASLDHVIPIIKGGTHTMDNVQAAHWICNVHKGTKDSEEVLDLIPARLFS